MSDKKPWEEAWNVVPATSGHRITSDTGIRVPQGYDPYEIGWWPGSDTGRVALISAAPDMARALVDTLRHGGNATWMDGNKRKDLHRLIREALTKAGVPLQ